MSATPSLAEPADEARWRALVEKALKGAPWSRLVGRTADGIEIAPLYREADIATATDISGFPGAAPFIRGGAHLWTMRQRFDHGDSASANRDILADLEGGVAAIELAIGPEGVAIAGARDLDAALADVILEAAPVSLDAGRLSVEAAAWLKAKLKGVAAPGTAFNIDLLTAPDRDAALEAAIALARELPSASALRIDARPAHEAGGTDAQEIAFALASGIWHLRLLEQKGLAIADAARALRFAVSAGPDVLVEAAKLRALRLCWARVLEASGAPPEARAARIHAFTARRMMTRYDAWTNILRVTTAAFAAAVGGADEITTLPFTDALGAPTPFARRLARNTQHVLMDEAHLGQVRDPAGGAWFVERLTRDLAAAAWSKMQAIEAQGGFRAALDSGALAGDIAAAREARAQRIATRRETITGVTDFPLLEEKAPEIVAPRLSSPVHGGSVGREAHDEGGSSPGALAPMRWAAPFEALRDRAEAIAPRPAVFFANMGARADFTPRANFARNLFAVGGVGAIGGEDAHDTMETLVEAFVQSGAKVAVLTGSDACYADHAANGARALGRAGCAHVILAGEPRATDAIQHFIWNGCNALDALRALHAALGIGS